MPEHLGCGQDPWKLASAFTGQESAAWCADAQARPQSARQVVCDFGFTCASNASGPDLYTAVHMPRHFPASPETCEQSCMPPDRSGQGGRADLEAAWSAWYWKPCRSGWGWEPGCRVADNWGCTESEALAQHRQPEGCRCMPGPMSAARAKGSCGGVGAGEMGDSDSGSDAESMGWEPWLLAAGASAGGALLPGVAGGGWAGVKGEFDCRGGAAPAGSWSPRRARL